jgi:hypothetical protein
MRLPGEGWTAGLRSTRGRTYDCELEPACRHDHQTKQTPGWTLTTPIPGALTWTTPGNRTHTTTPAQYWE